MSSYNNSSLPGYDKMVTCPYNKAHLVLCHRMAKHLDKCRISYVGEDLKMCKFNNTHRFLEREIKHHEKHCSDRLFVEQFLSATKKPFIAKPAIEVAPESQPSEENWDDEEHHESYDPKKYCERSNIIIGLKGMTKSQREAAREERYKVIMKRSLE